MSQDFKYNYNYSLNEEYPLIWDELPERIRLSNGNTRTDKENFTEDELKDEQTQTDAPQEIPEFELKWHDDALQKVMRIPISFIRNMAVKRIEQEVRKNEGPNKEVSMELFEKYRFSF